MRFIVLARGLPTGMNDPLDESFEAFGEDFAAAKAALNRILSEKNDFILVDLSVITSNDEVHKIYDFSYDMLANKWVNRTFAG